MLKIGRPFKSTELSTGKIGKEERQARIEQENKLKGLGDKIKPPKHLNSNQKKIFKYIVTELEVAKVLGNLDIYVLTMCSIALDRLQTIETQINDDMEQLNNKELLSAKRQYSTEFQKCITELSLSPASRTKLGALTIQNQMHSEDPLLKILSNK